MKTSNSQALEDRLNDAHRVYRDLTCRAEFAQASRLMNEMERLIDGIQREGFSIERDFDTEKFIVREDPRRGPTMSQVMLWDPAVAPPPDRSLTATERRVRDQHRRMLEQQITRGFAQAGLIDPPEPPKVVPQKPPEPEVSLLNPNEEIMMMVDDLSVRGLMTIEEIKEWLKQLHEKLQRK